MTTFNGQTHYTHTGAGCTGILITNLGTPDAPTPAAVRRYLAEFLSDPRVVEMPRALWLPILHGIILRIRPARVARAYQSVWTDKGAPLLYISQQLRAGLQAACRQLPGPVHVELAMRYGHPSIEEGLCALQQADARRILILPLYPQYSATTTATTFDAVSKILQTWRWLPELRMATHYHDHAGYIQAVADSIRRHQAQHGRPDKLLFSFHGLPKKYLLQGDPYFCECHASARLIAEALQLDSTQWQIGFQSRFGREEWLQPYTDHTLQGWGQAGIRHVQVVCPGFSVDCLETLEEIAVENRHTFLNAGGQEYSYIPALNAEPAHVDMLMSLIRQHTTGWPETDPGIHIKTAEELTAQREQALKMGSKQ